MHPTKPCLPQNTDDPAARAAELAEARKTFVFDYSLKNLGYPATVPDGWGWPARWKLKAAEISARTKENEILVLAKRGIEHPPPVKAEHRTTFREAFVEGKHEGLKAGLHAAWEAAFPPTPDLAPESVDFYRDMFPALPTPGGVEDWNTDWRFAYARVSGVNPRMLTRVTKVPENFPLTDELYRRTLPDDSLEAAVAEDGSTSATTRSWRGCNARRGVTARRPWPTSR